MTVYDYRTGSRRYINILKDSSNDRARALPLMHSNSAHALADIYRYILLECITRLRARRRSGSSIHIYITGVELDYVIYRYILLEYN